MKVITESAARLEAQVPSRETGLQSYQLAGLDALDAVWPATGGYLPLNSDNTLPNKDW